MKYTLIVISLLTVSGLANDVRLVMWTFPVRGRELQVPVELTTDYGYMVLNVGTSKEPKAHYILGDRKRSLVRHFGKKEDFLEAVAALDGGGVMALYTRCLVPSDLGLKAKDKPHMEVEAVCKKLKITVSEDSRMKCVCPNVKDSKR